MEDLGREVGERDDVIIGRRYGVSGMYVRVCRERWIRERIRARCKG